MPIIRFKMPTLNQSVEILHNLQGPTFHDEFFTVEDSRQNHQLKCPSHPPEGTPHSSIELHFPDFTARTHLCLI